jgi:hypothetical protein
MSVQDRSGLRFSVIPGLAWAVGQEGHQGCGVPKDFDETC